LFRVTTDQAKYIGSPGGTVDVIVTVVPESGKTVEVNTILGGLPAGATFTPDSGFSSGSVTFKISLAQTTAVGSYTLVARGVKSGVESQARFVLEVVKLEVSFPFTSLTVKQGESVEFSVLPKTIIDGALPTLSITDGWVTNARVTVGQFANGFARGTIATTANTPKGNYSVLLVLRLGNATGTATIPVTVT
jgi:hypothetical protein